jgi:hypothetical protein
MPWPSLFEPIRGQKKNFHPWLMQDNYVQNSGI